jgi:hypothetical protein
MSTRPLPSLHCARCGLEITIQATFLRIENCPRCLARSRAVSPLTFRDAPEPVLVKPDPDPVG